MLWGVYFGVILALEKLFLKRWLNKLPTVLQHLYAIVLVVISFVIFRIESITEAFAYLAGMFGIGLSPAMADATAGNIAATAGTASTAGISLASYQVLNYGCLIVAAVVIALGIPKWIWQQVLAQPWGRKLAQIVQPVWYVMLLLVVTAFLIQSSVHPFLYFRF